MPKPYTPHDHYAQKAQHDGFRARSAYKLKEIMERHPLFKKGDTVLDVGAYPGSWLQVAASVVGAKGHVIGVDMQPIDYIAPRIKTFVGDITDKATYHTLAHYAPYDAIISDAAPNTSGIKIRDQALSEELVECVITLSETLLAPNGCLAVKIFQSSRMGMLQRKLKQLFKEVHTYKPQASRDRSFETYLIGIGKK